MVYTILMAVAVLVLLRLLFERQLRPRTFASLGTVIRDELGAGLMVVASLFGFFILVFVFTLVFGPIPPVHEW
jgi:cadmium resistance protein CadD (predicted permease)